MPTCQACLEEAEELDEEGICPECQEHFDAEDAMREDELAQSLEEEFFEEGEDE
ncbi:MAG: hypothetical protein WC372_10355 [Candidatus Neomarinimicrobiota bacterium]|jgi:predicted amidophosphoribosyltransferase